MVDFDRTDNLAGDSLWLSPCCAVFSSCSCSLTRQVFMLRYDKCSSAQLETFMDRAGKQSAGWISFYWGKSPEELRQSSTIGDAIMLDWLTRFEARAKQRRK